MTIGTLNVGALIEKAHAQSTKSGFWDHDEGCPVEIADNVGMEAAAQCHCANRDVSMKIALIHSEISEALEEYRLTDEKRGGGLAAILYDTGNGVDTYDAYLLPKRRDDEGILLACGHCRNNVEPRHWHKPEGFIVELADAAIRCFDLCGFLDLGPKLDYYADKCQSVLQSSDGAVFRRLHCFAEEADTARGAVLLLEELTLFAERHGGDLAAAIEIKMAYNATRAFKHGGKRV